MNKMGSEFEFDPRFLNNSKTSLQISNQIPTIPMEQQYSIGDMKRIGKILNNL